MSHPARPSPMIAYRRGCSLFTADLYSRARGAYKCAARTRRDCQGGLDQYHSPATFPDLADSDFDDMSDLPSSEPAAASANPGANPGPKVSVVIPIYNEQQTVQKLIGLVVRAPLPPGCTREIICVNDASTDDS